MKHFLLKNNDGSVTYLKIIPYPDGTYSTPDAEMKKWHPTLQIVQSWREIKSEHLPTVKDRLFREAWRDVTPSPGVDIDMPKARDIHRNRLREMRVSKLAMLDAQAMQASFGNKDKLLEIETKKQALRDVTVDPAIEKASTPDELMAVIPDILKD